MQSNQFKQASDYHHLLQDDAEQGSTIVEVLVTLLIIGIVLAAGLAAANRTTEGVQQSHERAEALKVTESQVEQLRDMSQADTDGITSSDNRVIFCITDNPDNRISTAFYEQPPENYQDEDFLSYPDECKTGLEDRYHIHVIYEPGDGHYGTFYFHTRWERFGGDQSSVEEVAMPYRRDFSTGPLVTVDIPPGNGGPGDPPSPSECPEMTIGFEDDGSAPYLVAVHDTPYNNRVRQISYNLPQTLSAGCRYDISLFAYEFDHARWPVQWDQTQERFFIEGRSATNAVTFRTGPTPDIPECEGIEEPGDEILPGEPGYTECTQISSDTFTVTVSADTTSIMFRHLGQWDCNIYGHADLPGVNSTAECQTKKYDEDTGIRSNINSVHGYIATIVNAN